VLVANGVRVLGDPRVVGARQNHLQIRFAQGATSAKAIAWNMSDRGKKLTAGALCSVAFHPSINEWNGRREVQLEVKDFQLDEASAHAQTQPA
jgi:single-stranded-DNA-specific exonuclease